MLTVELLRRSRSLLRLLCPPLVDALLGKVVTNSGSSNQAAPSENLEQSESVSATSSNRTSRTHGTLWVIHAVDGLCRARVREFGSSVIIEIN